MVLKEFRPQTCSKDKRNKQSDKSPVERNTQQRKTEVAVRVNSFYLKHL
ncbi:unnamed protein product [Porites lobata]|uniref:Uncharacterized protein n=1 Tax=Porites lobata TaxID=104759 RepID=A0ABN8NB49_9CNID|nr:unnamed protein product [Porites lobata]